MLFVVDVTAALAVDVNPPKAMGGKEMSGSSPPLSRLDPLKYVDAGVLNVAYYETGPTDGPVAVLMHGFPYNIHSYVNVAPILAARGMRVIVPYLRRYAPTRFLDAATFQPGEQAAVGTDLGALMDALKIERAVVAGYDWGGRAACVVAALYPERVVGLVCVNSYLIKNISKSQEPAPQCAEVPLWYHYYLHQERGRAGPTKYRREIARILWEQWSPNWTFNDATFERAAVAFDSPDYVDVVIHFYRHRFGLVEGDGRYASVERRLGDQPPISVPAINLDGSGDGVVPATDGRSTASRFSNTRNHQIIPYVGHNLPQEAPQAFAAVVIEVANV